MNRYLLTHLTAEAARQQLDRVDLEEKGKLADGLALIALIDGRRDYRDAGYSSMLKYCMGRLHMSEDKAAKRLQVARVARQFPQVFEFISDGRLCVSGAVVLAPHLRPENAVELLAACVHLSRDEIVRMLAARLRPAAAPSVEPTRESPVQATSCQHAPGHAGTLADLCGTAGAEIGSTQHAPGHVGMTRRGRITPAATGDYDVRLSISEAEHEDLRKEQALLGHAVPSGDPAEIYARAMKHYLAHLEKQRFGVKPAAAVPAAAARGRGIPKSLRRLVWERDGARCTFVGTDGHRCEETRRLEIDHVTPLALGGATAPENLRLLCRAHNQHEAERVLGREHVQHRREVAQRERARAKVAAKASAARQQAAARVAADASEVRGKAGADSRSAAQQARHDDIHGALRGLGFNAAEARRGAALADTMPDASLEACLRLALAELTRPLALRGERLARCTA